MKKIISYLLGITLVCAPYFMLEGGDVIQQYTKNTPKNTTPITIDQPQKNTTVTDNSAKTLSKKMIHLPILMYHYVRTVTDQHDPVGIDLSVPANAFEEQMKHLSNAGYTTITLDDLVSAWKEEKNLPKKSIILTFDDGYDDFYTDAFPVLQKYNLKATAYIITDFIDKSRYLTSQQLKELDQSPLITIAAHTMHHPNLRNTTGTRLIEEVLGSKTWLENFTGHPILHFAYPSGQYNKETLRATEKAGYVTAVTTEPGEDHASTKPFTITRVRIRGGMTLEAFQKLFP